jgi:hypothetical protein
MLGDSPELPVLSSIGQSPASTQRDETECNQDKGKDSGDDTEVIPPSDEAEAALSSDFELPSISQILDSVPQTSCVAQ